MKRFVFFLWVAGFFNNSIAQEAKIDGSKYLPLVTFTQKQDHENMMQ